MEQVIVIVVIFAIIFFRQILKSLKEGNELPGPSLLKRIPYFGHSYLLGYNPIKNLFKFKSKYGSVFRLDIGNIPTVFLADSKTFNAAIKSGKIEGRPYHRMDTYKKYCGSCDSKGNFSGVAPSFGKVWNEQRKFMLQTLTQLGMGNKDRMEVIIQEEADSLIDKLNKSLIKNNIVNFHHYFMHTTNSVIWRIVTGKKNNPNDPDLLQMTNVVLETLKSFNPGNVFCLLQFFSPGFAKFCKFITINNLITRTRTYFGIIKKLIQQHNEVDGEGFFISHYLNQIKKHDNDPNSSFYKEDGKIHLLGQMGEIFIAGTETTSMIIEWMILYMTEYEKIQEEIHQSIVDIYGLNGIISLQDTYRLPLVLALIDELIRHGPMLALAIPHETESDVIIEGHNIKKGTQVYFFAPGVYKDPKIFSDPEAFNPYRFIDSDGNYVKNNKVFVFGYGKRKCVGEQLGRSELFIFIANLLQKFKFKKISPNQVLNFDPLPGLLFHAKEFSVKIEKRI